MKKFGIILSILIVVCAVYTFFIINSDEKSGYPSQGGHVNALSYFNTVTVDVFIVEFSPHSAPDINDRPEKSNQADSLSFKNAVTEAVRKKFGAENILIGGYEDPYTFLSNPFNIAIKLYVSRDLSEDRVNYQLKIIRSNLFSIFLRGLTSEKEMFAYNNVSPALANEILKTKNPFIYWEKNAFFRTRTYDPNKIENEDWHELAKLVVEKMDPKFLETRHLENAILNKAAQK
jgi:hypothetical protein